VAEPSSNLIGRSVGRAQLGLRPTLPSVRQRRLLVIDDEAELRTMLSSYLVAGGYEVMEASNGEQGLHLALSHDLDLAILDVGLPDMDGFEVLRRLRASSNLPVIMLTARAEEVDRVIGLTVGAELPHQQGRNRRPENLTHTGPDTKTSRIEAKFAARRPATGLPDFRDRK